MQTLWNSTALITEDFSTDSRRLLCRARQQLSPLRKPTSTAQTDLLQFLLLSAPGYLVFKDTSCLNCSLLSLSLAAPASGAMDTPGRDPHQSQPLPLWLRHGQPSLPYKCPSLAPESTRVHTNIPGSHSFSRTQIQPNSCHWLSFSCAHPQLALEDARVHTNSPDPSSCSCTRI